MSHNFTQFMLSQYKSHTLVSNIDTRMITAIKYSYVTSPTTSDVNVFLQIFDKVFACHFESIFIYLFLWLHNPEKKFDFNQLMNLLSDKSNQKLSQAICKYPFQMSLFLFYIPDHNNPFVPIQIDVWNQIPDTFLVPWFRLTR